MKKVFALILAAAMLTLASCSGNGPSSQPAENSAETPSQSESAPAETPSQSESAPAMDTAAEIASVMGNESDIENIWQGGGLPVGEGEYVPDENYQCFVPVTDERFSDVAALKTYTERVFTPEYAQERFYVYGLDAVPGARYKDVDGKLCEDIGQGGGLSQDWNLSTIVIVDETDEGCVAEIDYINYDTTYTSVITFVKTADGLRINAMEDKA